MQKRTIKSTVIMWLVLLGVFCWLAGKAAMCFAGFTKLSGFKEAFLETAKHPFTFELTEYSSAFLIIAIVAWLILLASFWNYYGKFMSGKEHGSADWEDPIKLGELYSFGEPEQCAILSKNVSLHLDHWKHGMNLNTVVVGGPGSWKSRGYVIPNILQCNANYITTDPSGQLLKTCGHYLEAEGYEILVLNLVDMNKSHRYNPFRYIKKEIDVITLINNLIKNTSNGSVQNGDTKFFEDGERALLQAIIFYLWLEAPEYEQNFSFVMYLLDNSMPKEEDENHVCPLDLLFKKLEMRDPEHIAVRQYKIYKSGAGKTVKSILISCKVRLSLFNIPSVRELTSEDDLRLERFSTDKVALFCIIPEVDKSFNFLVGLLYTQITQILYPIADAMPNGRPARHLRFMMDEFANVAIPEDFTADLNTGRKREMSFNIIIQNFAQLENKFNKEWGGVIDSCDTLIYLGGCKKDTTKHISEMLGKATIDYVTVGKSDMRLNSNKNITGRELMMHDEIRRMKKGECLIIMGNEQPMIDKKYDMMLHPKLAVKGKEKCKSESYEFHPIRGRSLASFVDEIDLKRYVYASEEVNN
jgi:type IV secretion system protein VirD4